MQERTHRVFAALGLLILVWIVVYWSWRPGDATPAITLASDEGPGAGPDRPPDDNAPRPPSPRKTPPDHAGKTAPPETIEHTIRREGASWRSISIELFATPDHADAIARANPFVDERRLRPGRVIRIPLVNDADAIQGGGPPEPPEPARVIEYTVQPGDSLSVISQKFYFTVTKADMLYEYNRERLGLRDKDSIRAGQVLLIPLAD